MPPYERRQVGRILIAVSVLQVVVGAGVFFVNHVAGLAIVGVGLLTPWLFGAMTVRVDDTELAFHFGPGIVGRRIPLADIRRCRVVTLPWYSGVGIHLTANGMLYNVAFGPVVQVELQNGRRTNIGSAEPDELVAAIRSRLGGRPAMGEPLPHAHGIPWPLASAILIAVIALLVAALVASHGGPRAY